MKAVLYTCLVIVVMTIPCAPSLLVYEKSLKSPDCIIVMLGHDTACRFRGAEELTKQSHARALLIPGYFEVSFVKDGVLLTRQQIQVKPVMAPYLSIFGHCLRIFENTHNELIRGKKIMDRLGFHSVIIVSSPFHMFRLKLIAKKVFDDKYAVGFRPTPFEQYDTIECLKSATCSKNVATEYLKIAWFLIYSCFV